MQKNRYLIEGSSNLILGKKLDTDLLEYILTEKEVKVIFYLF